MVAGICRRPQKSPGKECGEGTKELTPLDGVVDDVDYRS